MSDNLQRRKPEAPKKINLSQSWEVDFWINNLGVSEAKLRRAVSAVGVMVSDVKTWLAKH